MCMYKMYTHKCVRPFFLRAHAQRNSRYKCIHPSLSCHALYWMIENKYSEEQQKKRRRCATLTVMRQGSLDSFFSAQASSSRHDAGHDMVAGYLATLPPPRKRGLACGLSAGTGFVPPRTRNSSKPSGRAPTTTSALASSLSPCASSCVAASSSTTSQTTSAGHKKRTAERVEHVEGELCPPCGKRERSIEDDVSTGETAASRTTASDPCRTSCASASALLLPNTFRLANIAYMQNMSGRLYATDMPAWSHTARSSPPRPSDFHYHPHRPAWRRHGCHGGSLYGAMLHTDARNYFYRLHDAVVRPYRVHTHTPWTMLDMDTNRAELTPPWSMDSSSSSAAHYHSDTRVSSTAAPPVLHRRRGRDVSQLAVHDIVCDSQEEYTIALQRARLQLFHTQTWAAQAAASPRGGARVTASTAPILTLESSLVQNPYTAPAGAGSASVGNGGGDSSRAESERRGSGFSSTQFMGSSMHIVCGYTRRAKIDIFDLEDVDESDCCPVRAYDLTRVAHMSSSVYTGLTRPARANDRHAHFGAAELWEEGESSMTGQAAASAIPYVTDLVALSERDALAALSTGQSIRVDWRSAHVLPCTPPPPAYPNASATAAGTPTSSTAVYEEQSSHWTGTHPVWDAPYINSSSSSSALLVGMRACAGAGSGSGGNNSAQAQGAMTMMYTTPPRRRSAMTALARVPTCSEMQVVCGMSDGAVLLWDVRHTRRAISSRMAGAHAVGRMRVSSANGGAPRVWFTNFTGQLISLELSRGGAMYEAVSIPLASTSHSDESVFLAPPRVTLSAMEDFVVVPDVAGNALVVLDVWSECEKRAADWLHCAGGETESVGEGGEDVASRKEGAECMGCRGCGLQTHVACRIAMDPMEMQLSSCAMTRQDGLIYLGDAEGGCRCCRHRQRLSCR